MCTAYDVAMEIRAVMLGDATIVDVVAALAKGVAIGLLAEGLCGTVLGIVLRPMMAVFGLGSQVDQIQDAIEKGDPVEITVRVVQMACMLFGMTSQCFTGDTLVATEDGLKPIEDVKVGELVWSEDTETGEKELREVTSVSVTETVELVHVWVGKEEIKTTRNHPFYVEGEGWKAAGELVAGDVLRSSDGAMAVVCFVEIEELSDAILVYNLEVEDGHTYYVGNMGVLVHNDCGLDSGSGTTTKPNQVHHYATNKSKTYTPQLEEIANRYGLDLDDAWNKDLLPHQGRHPNAYHEYVLDSMKQFDNIAQGDKDLLLKLFDNLKNNVKSNPDMLYKDYWK